MSRKKQPAAPVEREEVALDGALDEAIPADFVGVKLAESETIPDIHSPEWTAFIMGKMLEDEVFDGHPTIEGLRRVTAIYLGDVIESTTRVVQSPNAQNAHHAVVEHHLTILGDQNVARRYSGAADVFAGNGDDPAFSWRYSVATCETRAESRAYRRALRLRHVCAAEEVSQVPIEDSGMDGHITPTQKDFIDMMCKRNDINAMKYIQSGKRKFDSLDDVPYQVAVNMCGYLQQLQFKRDTISPDIRGYDPRWLTPS